VKITAVHVENLLLEYDEPFVITSSALTAGPCNLVRVETDEGLVGFGEACAGFEFTGDTLWTVSDVINEYLGPAIVGMDPARIEEIVRIWDRDLWAVGNQAAKGGLEMALWDLLGKATGRPLCDLLGGRTRDALTEVIAFGWDEPEALAAKTRAMRAEGVTIFKIKVGDAPEKDEQRVAAVREAAGCDALITVDANQGWWDAKTAVRAIKLLDPYDLEAARWVRERVDLPIALDESVRGPREALACVEAGACDIFVIKLMKTGGILNALKVNAIGEAAGVTTMIGNMGESSLGLAAHFHVNMALANAVHADADVPTRPGGLKRDIAAGIVAEVRDGVSVVTLGDAPGIGVTIDEAAVAAQRVVRPWQ
jgi:L-alanine-DL-glutamate epimerase-like enolase superfamily enzyme